MATCRWLCAFASWLHIALALGYAPPSPSWVTLRGGEHSIQQETIRNQLLKDYAVSLKERISRALDEKPGLPPAVPQRFALEDLEREAGDGPVSTAMAEFLASEHYVVVRLPESSSVDMEGMWKQLNSFFVDLSTEAAKQAVAGEMVDIDGQVVGYAALDGNEFLETRLNGDKHMLPDMSKLPNFAVAVIRARELLMRISSAVLMAAACNIGMDPKELEGLVDVDSFGRKSKTMSQTVHRLCRYKSTTDGQGEDTGKSKGVAFGAHTDTTMLTLVPRSGVPGLEVHPGVEGGCWIRPESGEGSNVCDVVVMSGELMQALCGGFYSAAVHRVAGTVGKERLSAPLLLRARPGTTVDIGRLVRRDRAKGTPASVLERLRPLDGLRMEEIHRRLNEGSGADDV